jgi:type II secretory pathway component GspD/PulD (secretin)
MKKTLFAALTFAAALAPVGLLADPATPAPLSTQVQTHLRLEVEKETDTVHFISTNNDPNIITKTYVLKHADPYELRPYLRDALQSERISGGAGKVEAIKYNDGTGILLVSAEEYKFDQAAMNGGDTIDEIIEKLDQPQITSASGKAQFLYLPRYRSAADLATQLVNVGLDVPGSVQENQRGQDFAYVDPELNSIFFYPSKFSVKTAREMIAVFDQPVPEVKVNFQVYELEGENDDKLGVDFQAWKNGPGTDLFAAANRYANGWDMANNVVAPNDIVENSHTEFIKFNPKWNTRFLDFLTAKGKAKVVTGGELSIQNAQEGRVQALTEYAAFATGPANVAINSGAEYVAWTNPTLLAINTAGVGPGIQINGTINIYPTDYSGNPITVNVAAATAVRGFTITRIWDGTRFYHQMEVNETEGSAVWFERLNGFDVDADDINHGYRIRCLGNFAAITTWQVDQRYAIARDADRNTNINTLQTVGDTYGFSLRLIPSICADSTTLDINVYNTSLIGFANNGAPRTERSELNTKVMVGNNGRRFVIGGIEKKHVVRSVSKVPLLGSIPGLGWALSSEGESGKTSQLVVVLDVVPVLPDTAIAEALVEEVKALREKTEGAGEKPNDLGFDQFILDQEKTGL